MSNSDALPPNHLEVKPLRLDKSRLLSFGEPAEIRSLLALFFETSRDNLADLALCAAPEDRNRAAAAAHRLRGSASSIGAIALAAQVRNLEEGLRAFPAEEWPKAMADLHAEYSATHQELEGVLSEMGD